MQAVPDLIRILLTLFPPRAEGGEEVTERDRLSDSLAKAREETAAAALEITRLRAVLEETLATLSMPCTCNILHCGINRRAREAVAALRTKAGL